MNEHEELPGRPVDGIALTVYGQRPLEAVLQQRLLTHASLDELPAKAIKAIATDLAEEALKFARDFVFDQRVVNGVIVKVK